MITVASWLSFAFISGLIMRFIGLPPLVGYLATGFILSLYGYESSDLLSSVAHAGVLILLFSVGLKLELKSLFRLEIFVGSLVHIVISVALFYLLLFNMQDLTTETALFLALAMSFSSTVVAAKVLESKRELRAFHGRVAIGILVVQDIVAVGFLSTVGDLSPSPWAVVLLGFFLIRPVIHWLLSVSGHGELVVLLGIVLAIAVGAESFEYFGMSSELGALLLGILLSDHKRSKELSNALWGVKELLLVGFFLQIGLAGHPTLDTLYYALGFNLLLPVKAVLFFFILLLFRLRARSSFLAGLSLATYSEFGLIVASMGVSNGMLGQEWLVLLALTVAISFAVSAPINRYAHELYTRLEDKLTRFQSDKRHPDDEPVNFGHSNIILVGMGRVGTGAYDQLIKDNKRIVGLESDPVKVKNHRENKRRVLYADAEDSGLWSHLNYQGVDLIMFCVPDIDAKLMAIHQLRALGYEKMITATALFSDEVEKLKREGADHVYNYYDGIGSGFAKLSADSLQKREG